MTKGVLLIIILYCYKNFIDRIPFSDFNIQTWFYFFKHYYGDESLLSN